jgi:hypothetical protein
LALHPKAAFDPEPLYFDRAAAMVQLAQQAGMAVFLDPIETGGWLDVLRSNGAAGDQAYGRFVGQRFASFHNIVWLSGNDFQTWKDKADDSLVRAVARGIRSADPAALQTVELNYDSSASRDDSRWRGAIQLDAAYTYYPTYALGYSRSSSGGLRCLSSCSRPATSSSRTCPRSRTAARRRCDGRSTGRR